MRYLINPVPKPRMTRADKWKHRPATDRYWSFKDEVALNKVDLPASGASVMFLMPMPKSWSKKKREEMDGKPHVQKPDLDNLLKALCDAVYGEDSCVWHFNEVSKRWACVGSIVIVQNNV